MTHLQGVVILSGQSRRFKGFSLRSKGESSKKLYVQYQAHHQGIGDIVKDGAFYANRYHFRRVGAIFVCSVSLTEGFTTPSPLQSSLIIFGIYEIRLLLISPPTFELILYVLSFRLMAERRQRCHSDQLLQSFFPKLHQKCFRGIILG